MSCMLVPLKNREAIPFTVLTAFLSAGAAVGAMWTRRFALVPLCAPLVGLFAGAVSFYAATVAHEGSAATTWAAIYTRLVGHPGFLALLVTTVAAQAIAHAAGLLLRWKDEWALPAAFHLASGALIAAVGAAAVAGSPGRYYLVLACSAAVQFVPLKAALAVGRRFVTMYTE